jgi:FMN-dependent oxidoreductase (nitrilotriacetate monooxygenase family)
MAHIHFIHIYVDSPTTHIQSTWLSPADRQGTGHGTTAYWQDLARTLERGFFDGIFIADIQSIEPEFARQDIAFGSGIPRHDPLLTIPSMADATDHLGFGVTLSTAGTPPYLAVRRLGTLDNLTGGRVGWNVVTSYQKSDYLALGIDQPSHDLRYDMADEYLEICRRLWDAFPRDAIRADRDEGVFVDIDRIGRVEFAGQYYRCEGYPVIECSPQGRPLIFQAGSSGRGIRFAATHGDAIFALQPTMAAMKGYLAQVADAANRMPRPEDPAWKISGRPCGEHSMTG